MTTRAYEAGINRDARMPSQLEESPASLPRFGKVTKAPGKLAGQRVECVLGQGYTLPDCEDTYCEWTHSPMHTLVACASGSELTLPVRQPAS